MAILKNIPIHSSKGVASCINYVNDETKNTLTDKSYEAKDTVVEDDNFDVVLKYAKNLEKTVMELDGDKTVLVTGINCIEEMASVDFAASKYKYEENGNGRRRRGSAKYATYTDKKTGRRITVEKKPIDAEHFIQSFPGKEHGGTPPDPLLVHRIGVEYAKRAFPGFQCVVSTHMNTDHVHNHIVVCAYSLDGTHKICMNKALRRKLRNLNDEISLAHDLPILLDADIDHKNHTPDAPDVAEEYVRAKSHDGTSNKDRIRQDIDSALAECKEHGVTSWQGFMEFMSEQYKDPKTGISRYDISQTPDHVLFICHDLHMKDSILPFQARDIALGEKYMRKAICQRMGWDSGIGFDKGGEPIPERQVLQEEKKAERQSRIDRIDYISKDPRTNDFNMNISRYDENGCRRSNLEIVFLYAIKVLKYFKELIIDTITSLFKGKDREELLRSHPMISDIDKKILRMQRSMYAANLLGLYTHADIRSRFREIGKTWINLKKYIDKLEGSVKHYQEIESVIRGLQSLERVLKGFDLSQIDRLLTYPDKSTIRHEHALLEPMTSKQKVDLYNLLNNNSDKWKLTCPYNELTFAEAEQIIRFLSNKDLQKPESLISYAEYEKNKEERYLEAKYRHLHNKDGEQKPPMTEEEKTNALSEIIQSVDMERTMQILRYKDLKQKALNLGLSENNYDDYLHQLRILEGMLKAASVNLNCVTGEYRNIKMIDRDSKLAMDRSFTQEPYIAALKALEPKTPVKEETLSRSDEGITERDYTASHSADDRTDYDYDYDYDPEPTRTPVYDLFDDIGH